MGFGSHGSEDVSAGHLPDEIAFLARFGVDPILLRLVARTAVEAGVTADLVLLDEAGFSEDDFYRHLARHLKLPFMEKAIAVEPLARLDDTSQMEMVRLKPNRADLRYAIAPHGPSLRRLLRAVAGGQWLGGGRCIVTTPRRLTALIRRSHREELAHEASHALPDRHADLSARSGLTVGQILFGAVTLVLLGCGLLHSVLATLAICGLVASVPFLALVAVRLVATAVSSAVIERVPMRLPTSALPTYTVVVPLYREAKMVDQIVGALEALDYPALGSKLTKAD